MYHYLDCPVTGLSHGARFLTGAMRSWVMAVGTGRCASAQMVPVFGAWRMLSGLQPFLHMMGLLNRYGLDHLHFGNQGCDHVHEDEAVLLGLIRQVREGDMARVRAVAEKLVEEEGSARLVEALCELDMAMQGAGLDLDEGGTTDARVRHV